MSKNVIIKHDQSIDILRIAAAFAVVVIHVSAYYLREDLHISNALWWFANMSNSFSRWCVPVFIMISGSLLIKDQSFHNADLFFKKRLKRILIPLLFWSIFFIGFNKYITGFFTVSDTIGRLYIGEPYYHLWYLYLIVGLYLVTPVISLVHANFSAKNRIFIIAGVFVAGAINSMWSKYFGLNQQFFIFKFVLYLGYFMMGREISTMKLPLSKYSYLAFWFLSSILITILSGLLRHLDFINITFFYDYLNPLVIVQSISFYVFMQKSINGKNLSEQFKKVMTIISALTFGIYIVHPVFIEMGFKMLKELHIQISFILLPVFSVVVFLLSAIVTYFFTKIPYIRKLV